LLKEKGRSLTFTKLFYLQNPSLLHWAGTRTGLAADDHPVDAIQTEAPQRANQGLAGKKADVCWYTSQELYPTNYPLIFDAGAHPDIPRPSQRIGKFQCTFWALRKHLERVLRASLHNVKDLFDIIERYGLVEHIAHRIHKD